MVYNYKVPANMPEDEKNGISQPAHVDRSATPFDVTMSGFHVVNTDSGETADNPLIISDQVKRDNIAIYIRKTTIWCAHTLVVGIFMASVFGQLACTPPRFYEPPYELMAIIVGVYTGASIELITKIIENVANMRGAKK